MTKFEMIIKERCKEQNLDYKIAMRIYDYTFKYIYRKTWSALSKYSFMDNSLKISIPYVGKLLSRRKDTTKFRREKLTKLYRIYSNNLKHKKHE